ncbi:unnamed protein product [Malus baccata var. baccata]
MHSCSGCILIRDTVVTTSPPPPVIVVLIRDTTAQSFKYSSAETYQSVPFLIMAETTDTDFMRCELKLDTSTPGWHKTMTKVLNKIKGVSCTIDTQAGIAYVSGTIEPNMLLKLLAKSGKHAELLRVDSGYKHQFYEAKPVANYTSGQDYGAYYHNNHDYGYYGHNGSYETTIPYHHHPQHYPNYYDTRETVPAIRFPQPPPPMQVHPFYDPDTQCTIM